ncbi:hypothetical protein FGG08_003602 [Glutinoglossum americanum]|uniref:Leucine rich repeat protein n=1 Tax=Glutinoglossum americanum TaxID=1670608 RepID=A0A9P8I2C3_9PEZI|nr:hypothetical protein FGG08_003602 [Glutinoglossum americanum]
MAQNLPTYEEATSRNHWRLVGPYQLVHTVDLSTFNLQTGEPSAIKLLEMLDDHWLKYLLCGTLKLQSLNVCNFPIITYLALARTAALGQTELRLLNASLCNKTTSKSLSQLLTHFPALVYLDLSSTKSASSSEVIHQISSLSRLQILKLRGVGLQDARMEALAYALRTQVWSLDVRHNNLSDMCIDALLDSCFRPPDFGSNGLRELQGFLTALQTATENAQNRQTRASSSRQSTADAQAHDTANPPPPFTDIVHSGPSELENDNDSETYMASYLASHPHAHIELSERPNTGLTHLYVAGNGFTANGVAQLLRTSRLKAFDCGSLHTSNTQHTLRAEDLIPELAHNKLTYLRIDHRIFGGDDHPRSSAITIPDGRPSVANDGEPELSPAALPDLRHLVLTDVPTMVSREHFTDALKTFLHQLADQERRIAHKEAADAAVWASLPASVRASRRRERDHYSPIKRGLRKLDLELASQVSRCRFGELQCSVTEDADAETFQQASANDYSFFSDQEYDFSSLQEPNEMDILRQQIMDLGIENNDNQQSPPISVMTEPRRDFNGDVEMTSSSSPPPSYDNVIYGGGVKEIIARFRRERRETFEEETKMGRGGPGAGGHWSGSVRIVRGG